MADRSSRLVRRLAIGYAALLVATWLSVSRWAAIGPSEPRPSAAASSILDGASAAQVLGALRGLMVSGEAPVLPPAAPWQGRAALHCAGQVRAEGEVRFDGTRLLAPSLARSTLAGLDEAARSACRIRLDVEHGRGPVSALLEPLTALSIIPGLDALGVTLGDREFILGPDELLRADLLAGHRPLPGVDMELGLDVAGALRALALRAGVDGPTWRRTPHHLFRIRYQSWVEAADPAARSARGIPLLRGHSPAPSLSPASLRSAAAAAAGYLVRHLRPEGRFHYQYDPIADQVIADSSDYSLPRHAGATWFLSQAGAALGRPDLLDGARRALGWMRDHGPAGCDRPEWACAGNPGERTVDLGSSAIALLAETEYRRATGDATFDPWARGLAAFLVRMQRDDGDFRHLYDLDADRPDERTRLLYYSGEAALALTRLAEDPGTSPAERAALAGRVDRALRWLSVDNYDYFAGGFFYGEDHWTCIAAEAAWDLAGPGSSRQRWGDFCEGFAGFLERSRFAAGEGPVREQPDLVGAYGFTPLAPPHPTPVGSRSESLVSVYRLASRRGHAAVAERVARGLRDSMGFLLAHQLRPDDTWMMPDPAAALGGFTMSDARPVIRIDFLQHAGSAMLRAADLPAIAGADPATPAPAAGR